MSLKTRDAGVKEDDMETMEEAPAQCGCPECSEYGGPNPKFMMVKFAVFGAQTAVALYGLVKERSWKALGAYFGGFTLFWTAARALTCARCPNYGKNCYSLYLGKATSMLHKKGEGEIGPLGMALEVTALSLVGVSPAIGLMKNKRLFALYQLFSTATLVMHFSHACRHCGLYAEDWRKDCPAAKTARLFFGGGREVAL
jgi:hypothetical protein